MKYIFALLLLPFAISAQKKFDLKTIDLSEVIIKTKKQPMIWSGDTLIIRTENLDTKPHADASEIFDNVSGLSIQNGSVSILGQPVGQLSIDGKKIFGGIPIVTLNSIKAEMVQQIEVIEKINEFGGVERTVNLKLKDKYKNGIFGEISAGHGTERSKIVAGKYNKLEKNGFTNSFIGYNTINEKGLDNKDFEKMIFNSFRNSLSNNNSMVGLYDNNNLVEGLDIEKLSKNFTGINKFMNGGGNITYSKAKNELDGFLFVNKNQQFLDEDQQKTFLFNNLTQKIEQRTVSSNNTSNLHFNLNAKTQINPKTTFRLSQQISRETEDIIKTDTTLSSLGSVSNTAFSTTEKQMNNFNHSLQSYLNKKGNKRGVNSTLYLGLNNNLFNSTTSFNNQFDTFFQDQKIVKHINTTGLNTEFIQSYPVNKSILVEFKANQVFEKINSTQESKITNYFMQHNSKQEIGLYVLFQKRAWQIIGGTGYWGLNSERQNNETNYKTQIATFKNHLAKINYRLNNKTSFSLRFDMKPQIPNWEKVGAIPDSSNWIKLSSGNIFLNPSVQNKAIFSVSHTLKERYFFSLNFHASKHQNYIIENTKISSLNSSVLNTYTNSSKTVQEFGFGYSVIQINPQSKISFNFVGNANKLNYFVAFENNLLPLQNNIFFNQLNVRYKPKRQISFSTNWQSQVFIVQKNISYVNNINNNVDVDFGKKWYFNAISKFVITDQSQFFFDFGLEKFCLKNDVLKISLIAQNLSNNLQEIKISSKENAQFRSSYNYLPRLFLLKCTYFPEKWK